MKLIIVELIAVVLCFYSASQVSGTVINIGVVNVTTETGYIPQKYILSNQDIEASKVGASRLEYLRRFIKTGIDYFPILDPYKTSSLVPVSFNYPGISGTLNLRNLVARGAQDFNLQNLEIRVQNDRLDFDVYNPELKAELDFETVDFIYNGNKLDYAGHLSLNLTGHRAVGAIHIEVDEYERDDSIWVKGLIVNHHIQNVTVELSRRSLPLRIHSGLIDEIILLIARSVMLTAIQEINYAVKDITYTQLQDFLRINNNQ